MNLEFARHRELTPPRSDWELAACSVSDDGDAICLWVSGAGSVVTRTSDDAAVSVSLDHVRFPAIGALPEGGFVITDTRLRVDPVSGARGSVSSWVFDGDGEVVAEGSLGDGIEHLLTTPGGAIWVGYFDEGVYGGGEIEHHGLVRFDANLEPEWLFPYGEGHGTIDDCYALNVFAETATAYYYGDFNIAQVRGGTISSWSGSPAGAHGLMVDGDQVVLIGGYRDERHRTVSLTLTSNGVQIESTGRHTGLPDRQQPLRRICRGQEMHVLVGPAWYRASIGT